MGGDAVKMVRALTPVVDALGGTIVSPAERRPGDLPVRWDGQVALYVRPPDLHDALDRLIAAVETELGRPCTDMDRSQKQVAVRRLDEQGAFRLRGAVEEVAARMGVTRATLYTYLNAIRPADSGP